MIVTRTLRFWGFKEHPFGDNILKEELLKLFVDRDEELTDVEDALGHSRIVGVYGSLGVGKSSFLHKLKQVLTGDGFPVAFVHLTADSEDTLYREILAELIALILSKNLKLKSPRDFDAKKEAERLVAGVDESRGSNFAVKLLGVLGVDRKDEKKKQISAHDETSARVTIRKIFDALKAPLIVVLDDFEKLRYEAGGKERDYFPILSRFVGTLEEAFNHKEVSFVVSMDNRVETLLEKSRKKKEAFAFSLNSLCELPNLELDHLHDFIRVRLKAYGWKGKVADFITEDAFLALALASSSHPRRAVRILAEAMKAVVGMKGKKRKQIDVDAMRIAAQKAGCELDVKDWIIVSYLRDGGEGSASDEGLRKALGFNKPKRADGYHSSVDRRLRNVAASMRLEFDEIATGTTQKKILRLPEIKLD